MRLRNLISPAAYKEKIRQYFVNMHGRPDFDSDGMRLQGKNLTFLKDNRFMHSYREGMNSGHHIGRDVGSDLDIHIEYRVYIECWAASQCLMLPGDFVTCGVNTGIMPLAICNYLDFQKSTDKTYWLFDTYEGTPEDQMSAAEKPHRIAENAAYYSDCYVIAENNFRPFPNAKLIKGKVPDTLPLASIDKVAYLAIDMNIAYPERKAIEYFWPKLSPGALVILDDYGFTGFLEQHISMDQFAASVGVSVLTLPTGQGLIKKPG